MIVYDIVCINTESWIYLFLRRNISTYIIFVGTFGGLAPPPHTKKLSTLVERGTPPSQTLADKGFRRHGNIGYFQRRFLANYWDECIWNVMLKARCYRLAPLLFGGNHILIIFICSKYMHQKLFFRAQNAKFSLPWEVGTPPPRPSPRNSPRRLLSEGFGDMELIFSPNVQNFHLVLFNSWWIAWKLLWKNCHKSIKNKVDIALQSI